MRKTARRAPGTRGHRPRSISHLSRWTCAGAAWLTVRPPRPLQCCRGRGRDRQTGFPPVSALCPAGSRRRRGWQTPRHGQRSGEQTMPPQANLNRSDKLAGGGKPAQPNNVLDVAAARPNLSSVAFRHASARDGVPGPAPYGSGGAGRLRGPGPLHPGAGLRFDGTGQGGRQWGSGAARPVPAPTMISSGRPAGPGQGKGKHQ